jgi:hypothetical protein
MLNAYFTHKNSTMMRNVSAMRRIMMRISFVSRMRVPRPSP